MRLDKYLKNSRLIKRRTIAKEACEGGKVYLNGKQAKPGAEVKTGDIIEIMFGEKRIKAEITDISDNVSKAAARDMYRLIQG